MKKRIILFFISIFAILSLSSCNYNSSYKFKGYCGEENDRLYIGAHLWIEAKYEDDYLFRFYFAKSPNKTFDTKYCIYYYTENTTGVILECPLDFGTTDTYNIRDEIIANDNGQEVLRFGFTTDFTEVRHKTSDIFKSSENTVYFYLAPEGTNVSSEEELDNYANVFFKYIVENNIIKIIHQ